MKDRKELHGNSFCYKHKTMMKAAKEILKSSKPYNYKKMAKESCNCCDGEYNYKIYGVKFLCLHTLITNLLTKESYIYFSEINSEEIQSFFLSCLTEYPEHNFEDKLFDSHVCAIAEKISSEIQDEEVKKYTKMLAVDFLSCFK